MNNSITTAILISKKLLSERKKTLLMFILGYLGGCLAIGLWCGFMNVMVGSGSFLFYTIIAGLCTSYIASKMWADFTSKEGKIRTLMLPATPAQKFWPRFIAIVPGMVLLVTAGYFILAYGNIFARGITFNTWDHVNIPFRDSFNYGRDALWNCWLLACFTFSEGMFILGSIFWPKKSFIKTSACFVGIEILLSLLAIFLVKRIMHFQMHTMHPEVLEWGVTAAVGILGILMIWLSYWKLKRVTLN